MAVNFDGTTIYWSTTNAAATASKKGTLVAWVKPDSVSTLQTLFAIQDSGESTLTFALQINANGGLTVTGRDASNVVNLSAVTANSILTASTWYAIFLSFDNEAGAFHLYVNRTDRSPTPSTQTDSAVDFSEPVWYIGGQDDGSGSATSLFDGGFLELAFWPGEYLDLTDTSTRPPQLQWLRAADNNVITPVSYIDSTPFDTDPYLVYENSWLSNLGSGVDLTRSALPTRVNGPDVDRDSAQSLRGEKWGRCAWCGWVFPRSQLIEQRGQLACTTGPHDADRPDPVNRRHNKHGVFFL